MKKISSTMDYNKVCRLCVNNFEDGKPLYDENGRANVLHEITCKYFHPQVINMDEAKVLNHICSPCWRRLSEFHSFQTTTQLAQLKLLDINIPKFIKKEEDEGGVIKKEINITSSSPISIELDTNDTKINEAGTLQNKIKEEENGREDSHNSRAESPVSESVFDGLSDKTNIYNTKISEVCTLQNKIKEEKGGEDSNNSKAESPGPVSVIDALSEKTNVSKSLKPVNSPTPMVQHQEVVTLPMNIIPKRERKIMVPRYKTRLRSHPHGMDPYTYEKRDRNGPRQCSICGLWFPTPPDKLKHYEEMHSTGYSIKCKEIRKGLLKYPCPMCRFKANNIIDHYHHYWFNHKKLKSIHKQRELEGAARTTEAGTSTTKVDEESQ